MPNGMYEPIVKTVLDKAAKTGIDSLDAKETTLLLASEMHIHSAQAKVNQEETKAILQEGFERQQRPFWKLWTYRELLTAFALLATILGAVNGDRLIALLTAVASAASGAR